MMIEVTRSAAAASAPHMGELRLGALCFPCALGRSGLVSAKREGDGGTPIGRFKLLEIRYRADRLSLPITQLPMHATQPEDGWCDAPLDPAYNRPVRLPYPASTESLWREDQLYDLVIILDYNMSPVRAYAGSAIFFHLAKEENGMLAPTEGCVALRQSDMMQLLPRLSAETQMRIRL